MAVGYLQWLKAVLADCQVNLMPQTIGCVPDRLFCSSVARWR